MKLINKFLIKFCLITIPLLIFTAKYYRPFLVSVESKFSIEISEFLTALLIGGICLIILKVSVGKELREINKLEDIKRNEKKL